MKNKKIIILGGTGFVGHFLKNILDASNHITCIGRSTQISYHIGQEVTGELKELISSSDVVIFASWDFHIEENTYIKIHIDSVLQILKLCREMKTSFLFVFFPLSLIYHFPNNPEECHQPSIRNISKLGLSQSFPLQYFL